MPKSDLEDGFASVWYITDGPQFVREHKFHETRKWRFDFAWPAQRVAVEMEGGVFMAKGGHRSIDKFTRDAEKYNEAAALGWRIVRIHAKAWKDDPLGCIELVRRCLEANPRPPRTR